MRIRVLRTGGFAGIERRAEVDTSGRPDAPEWQALAERVLAAGRSTPPAGVPDGFAYEITVDGRTVYAADPRLTEDERELVSRLLKEGA
ncbi:MULTISPECIES: protealysin inhibitor emfourin [unclassified Streptomyces]|uniref:protealysin inhibitor emfourin n=1 Tax=unclassified Streptomyces TaxID=2593676 RepID=UPI0004C16545|nr:MULTISPECIES: protealysin inhibitor emfourin [unclassified Streptomyces]KOV94997.1 metalloprotease [Streptomyces sp. NRRL B-3648]